MERDDSRVHGAALRGYLEAHLPVEGARSVSALARKAGLRPTTVVSWWTKGHVPDNTSLAQLAAALGVEFAELVAAYQGTEGRLWVLSDRQLRQMIDEAAQAAVERTLAERERRERD